MYRRGRVQLTVTAEGIFSSTDLRVVRNPVRKIELFFKEDDYRTGDVITFEARALTASGRAVEAAPVLFSFTGKLYMESDCQLADKLHRKESL